MALLFADVHMSVVNANFAVHLAKMSLKVVSYELYSSWTQVFIVFAQEYRRSFWAA